MLRKKKGQISIEFIVIISIATTFLIVFLLFGTTLLGEKTTNKEYAAMRDLGYALQSEFILAASSERGYQRTFFLPSMLDMINYSISNTNQSFTISYKDELLTFFVPEFEGNISKGDNLIITNQTHIIVYQP